MNQRIGKLAVFSFFLLLSAATLSAQTPVFINEIHYDNIGTDSGEFVEVAGPAGTDLTGWSIVLYNGNTAAAAVPYDTDALPATIPNQQNGFGTVSISYAVNGIQNGPRDGIALVNNLGAVVQFLSYAGVMTAAAAPGGGPAAGMTSTDIGVAESNATTAVGSSLQLQGTGTVYEDFTWTAPIPNTQNAPNTGQTFSPLTISINDVTVSEGNAGTSLASFTVSLNRNAPAGGVTFDIATADGTATVANNDYVANALNGQTIPAGQSTYTFDVTINGDTAIEPNETFFVNLTNVVGAVVGDAQGMGTITNDEGPPALSIDDVIVTEGDAGTVDAIFTVSLTTAAASDVTFDIATADDTATAGSDYAARSLTGQTIVAGNTTYSFTVVVNGDTTFETNETFFVNLTNVVGATVNDAQGTGTIANDDAQPSLSINDVSVSEGNAGTSNATFTVTLSAAAGVPVSVQYTTANGTAAAGSDYTTTSGTLNFAAGETTKTIDVPILGDTVPENDETFVINLTLPVNASVSDPQATGTIVNDDPISIAAVNTAYGENFDSLANSGTSSSTPGGWYFAEAGANANNTYAAGTGSDNAGNTYSFGAASSTERAFGGLRSGSLIPTIGAFYRNDTGVTVTTLTIDYTGEQYRLGTNGRADRLDFQYSLDATSLLTGTWTNVDQLDFTSPNTTAASGTTLDGNAAGNKTDVTFTITGLSLAPGEDFWIRWTDPDAGGADDGLSIDDFTIIANIAGGGQVLAINDVSVTEGNAGTTTATFTVTLSAPAGVGGVTFDIATADGTATAGSDYVARSLPGQVIPEGGTTYMFTVDVNGDTTGEGNETFFVNVTNVAGAILNDGQGLGTILNDDFTVVFIHDVQGSGNVSPFNGQVVTVSGIVTGIKTGGSGGFFVQEEDIEVDADPNTSEGIFVFTGNSVPAGVVIGNQVAVTGTVSEFPASAAPHGVTELSSVTVLAQGAGVLPAPVVITAAEATPSANLSHYERFEGMRVSTTLTVVAPTDGNINEFNATSTSNGVFYGIPVGAPRPFREPGHDLDTPIPSDAPCPACIPRFDTNPEKLRVDSDNQPGALQLNVTAGQTVANLVGPLDYGFFEYTLLPEAASVPVVTGPAAAVPIPAQLASELTVSSFNLQRFYDTVDFTSTPNAPGTGDTVISAAALNNRLTKASLAIRNILLTPDVLGVVEVENLATLQMLADRINSDAVAAGQPNPQYVAYLEEGNDIGGIDVGFLVKSTRVTVIAVTQLGLTTTFVDPGDGSVDILNDRPPLMLQATILRPDGTPYAFTVINNHLRSLNNAADDNATGRRIRTKRAKQAEFLANFVQARQAADPTERIILVGDFNAFQFSDGLVDVIGTIKGTPAPATEVVVASPDLVNPDLTNLVDTIPADQRYSYVFDGNAQVLDHAIVNAAFLADVSRVFFAHVDADFPEIFRNDTSRPERISDHDAIVAYFDLTPAIVVPGTADLVITKTAPASAAPGANVTFTITVTNNGPAGATNVLVNDVLPAGTTFVSATASQGTCSGTTTVTCSVGSLANAATATITITALTTGVGTVTNTATVSATEADANPANNTSTSTTLVALAIPTMSEWMLLALALGLVAAGAMRLRL